MATLIDKADALAMAAEHLLWQVSTNEAHLGGCRPFAGPLSSCEPGCAVDELSRALQGYLEHRSARLHGWRGTFARRLGDALARVSTWVGGQ